MRTECWMEIFDLKKTINSSMKYFREQAVSTIFITLQSLVNFLCNDVMNFGCRCMKVETSNQHGENVLLILFQIRLVNNCYKLIIKLVNIIFSQTSLTYFDLIPQLYLIIIISVILFKRFIKYIKRFNM